MNSQIFNFHIIMFFKNNMCFSFQELIDIAGEFVTQNVNQYNKKLLSKIHLKISQFLSNHATLYLSLFPLPFLCIRLVESEIRYEELKVLMGHSSIKTTIDVYTHIKQANQKVYSKLEGIVGGFHSFACLIILYKLNPKPSFVNGYPFLVVNTN